MSFADSLAHDPLAAEFTQVIDPSLGNDDVGMYGMLPQPEPEREPAPEHPAASNAKELEDLFGDVGDEDEEKEGGPESAAEQDPMSRERTEEAGTTPDADGLTSPERRRRKHLEYEEDSGEEGDDTVLQTEGSIGLPRLPLPHSSEGGQAKYWMLHLPNYVAIDPKPFDTEMYAGPEEMDPEIQPIKAPEARAQKVQERSHFIQYQVKNALRWRWLKGEDGELRKVSNARFVRWSDGSLSCQIGSEFWDVVQTLDDTSTSKDTSFSVLQHPSAGILQATRSLTGSLALRPTGLNSRTHRDLVRAIGQKHGKVARLLLTNDTTQEQEAELKEILKREKKAAAKRRIKERAEEGLTPRKRRQRARREELWSDEEEEEEYAGEDDDEPRGRGSRTSARQAAARESRRAGSYEEDDFVVKDTDEEDEGEGEAGEGRPRKSTKRVRSRIEQEELEGAQGKDSIEEADDILEEERRRRKKAKAAKDGAKGDDDKMDVDESSGPPPVVVDEMESEEEDEDDTGVRRAGAGAGKRRLVLEDDEDE